MICCFVFLAPPARKIDIFIYFTQVSMQLALCSTPSCPAYLIFLHLRFYLVTSQFVIFFLTFYAILWTSFAGKGPHLVA